MKKRLVPIVVFLLISISTLFTGHALSDQKPLAFLSEQTLTFEPAWDGDTVSHDFIVKNKGNAPLEILKVESD